MRKWEYRIEMAVKLFEKWSIPFLDKLGDEGWEAVGIFYDVKYSQTYILFKREK